MKKLGTMAITSIVALTAGVSAAQADKLTLYCSAQEDWCQLMARSFEDATGIDVNMTRKSSGETFAQIKARVRQSQRRCLVGRYGGSTPASGRRKPDGCVCFPDAG